MANYIVAVRDSRTVQVIKADTMQYAFTITIPSGEINGTPTASGETIVIPYRTGGRNWIVTYEGGRCLHSLPVN